MRLLVNFSKKVSTGNYENETFTATIEEEINPSPNSEKIRNILDVFSKIAEETVDNQIKTRLEQNNNIDDKNKKDALDFEQLKQDVGFPPELDDNENQTDSGIDMTNITISNKKTKKSQKKNIKSKDILEDSNGDLQEEKKMNINKQLAIAAAKRNINKEKLQKLGAQIFDIKSEDVNSANLNVKQMQQLLNAVRGEPIDEDN